MAEVLLFHHAQGLTPGMHTFADELRAAGHTVHLPDLFEGRVFESIDKMQRTRIEKTRAEATDDFEPWAMAALAVLATVLVALLGLRYTPW